MARPLRLDLGNGWYHVANRGNNWQAIYLDERDRKHFLDLLPRMIEKTPGSDLSFKHWHSFSTELRNPEKFFILHTSTHLFAPGNHQ